MKIPWNGVVTNVKVIMPVLLVTGDTKSQDCLVGRYASNHPNIGRLTFACDCAPKVAHWPYTNCSYLEWEKIHSESLKALNLNPHGEHVDQEDRTPEIMHESNPGRPPSADEQQSAVSYLKSIAQYPVLNVFSFLAGVNKIHGIFTAAVTDIMHTVKSGIMRYIIICFFALMTGTQRDMFDYVVYHIFRANRQTVFFH